MHWLSILENVSFILVFFRVDPSSFVLNNLQHLLRHSLNGLGSLWCGAVPVQNPSNLLYFHSGGDDLVTILSGLQCFLSDTLSFGMTLEALINHVCLELLLCVNIERFANLVGNIRNFTIVRVEILIRWSLCDIISLFRYHYEWVRLWNDMVNTLLCLSLSLGILFINKAVWKPLIN